MNLGTLVLGVLNGLTIGLLAVGFVLVYKANRFLNLAHGQLGTLSAVLLAKFVLDNGWSWWLAFAFALVLGLVTGLVVERLFVGPLRERTSSPVTLLLLSLGISQLLLALTYAPHLTPDPSHGTQYPQPFHATVKVGGVVLTGMSLLTLAVVPALVVALAVFLKYSLMGKQIRAAANNPDAARLCGVSVKRVSAVTWGIAGTLAAVTAVLQAPNQPSFNVATLGPYLLLLTVGAAAFGAFVSVPLALVGGVLIGVVSQLVSSITSSGADAELSVFVLVIAVVLFRGKDIGRAFALSGAVVQDRPVLRVPAALRTSPLVLRQAWWLGGAALIAGVILPQLPYFSTAGHRFLLSLVLIYALLGVALTMLLGWAGQVSLGHFAVVGIAAYLAVKWAPHGWSLPALCLLTGVVGAVVLVLIGLPALRVRGLTLAVTTLGLAVITPDWLLRQTWMGGGNSSGVSLDTSPPLGSGLSTPRSPVEVYYVALGVLVLGVLAAAMLRRSMPGRVVVAVRDNERASASFGVSPATVKLSILAVSGFFAGPAGVLWAEAWKSASPSHFDANISLALIAIPVIGGLGSVAGAVAAAATLYGATFFLGPLVAPVFGDYGRNLGFALFLAGAGQIYALLRLPTGLAGAAQHRWESYLERRAARPVVEVDEEVASLPLRTSGIRVHFGGVVALDSPDIVVNAGEIVGLIGTNGAGKTTLMNVISGVLTPDRGSVLVFGHEVVDLPPDFRPAYGLSRSFQDATLFAGLTVTETVQLALSRTHKIGFLSSMLGAPWARAVQRRTRAEAEAIVDRFGLGDWRDARTADLSTGTKRICDLAAQVAARPRLLVLDEPTAGVAQREAEAFGPLLRRIRDELDCAILIVEHDMPLLMGLCDRLYALETGTVIAEGTPEEIRHDPRVVESYLGTKAAAIDRSGATAPVQPPPQPVGDRVPAGAQAATAVLSETAAPRARRSTRRAT